MIIDKDNIKLFKTFVDKDNIICAKVIYVDKGSDEKDYEITIPKLCLDIKVDSPSWLHICNEECFLGTYTVRKDENNTLFYVRTIEKDEETLRYTD